MHSPRQRLAALRALMSEHGLDAYLVPSGDPHMSEYVPTCWERRQWLSGFNGSAGDVLVSQREAGLWTDGRYFLQAEQQLLGSGIRLFRAGEAKVPSIERYLADNVPAGGAVGVDPRVMSAERVRRLEQVLAAGGARLVLVDENLVDRLWAARPPPSSAPIAHLPLRFSGESASSKLKRLRRLMREHEASAYVATTLDSIAWLFNLRGVDVEFNPVFISYALVTGDTASLFVDPKKVPRTVRARLEPAVRLRPYRSFGRALAALGRRRRDVWVDPATANRWVVEALAGAKLVEAPGPVDGMKAVKNRTELAGIRAAHVRDGVAMVRFLRWLPDAVRAGGVTEVSAADELEAMRARGEHFKGLSFPTIAGYQGHGAIIHYRAEPETASVLRPRGLLLIDSGAQYLDGTTDITRTISLGARTSRIHRDRFTRVLKGHISLATARFPEGCSGARLDTLARRALWDVGLDYGHGTGHGVGAYLNVHEGPQAISFGRGLGSALEVGNIQSNEPGYYEPGEFGIRIENLVEVVADAPASLGRDRFLRFETLTLCPIDTRLVEPTLLSPAELGWLNRYHARVLRELGPLLESVDRHWLRAACAPVRLPASTRRRAS